MKRDRIRLISIKLFTSAMYQNISLQKNKISLNKFLTKKTQNYQNSMAPNKNNISMQNKRRNKYTTEER